MKTKLLPLFLAALLAVVPATARKRTFNLQDYGVLPGEARLGEKLRQALEQIKASAEPGDRITLKFKKGSYDFHAADAAACERYVSNHDQDQPKRVAIDLQGWQDLTFDGSGSAFVFHGRLIPLSVADSKNCTFRNFSIDFANPQIAQVEIVGSDAEKGITFKPAPWVKWRIAAGGFFETFGEGWTCRPVSGIAFEKQTRHIVYNTADLSCPTAGVKDLGNGTLLAPEWKDERLAPGTVVTMRTWARPTPGIFVDECANTTFKNVTVHYAEGMGLLAQRSADITLDNFNVCLKGKDDPRYFTTQADATHFSQCRGKIVSTGGLYEGMMDDAVNIHGIYLKVTERKDDHSLVCTYGHGQAWGFAWGDKGDTVRFVRAAIMETVGEDNVIADIRPLDAPSAKGAKGFLVRFEKPVPQEVDTHVAYGVENLTWTPEVRFAKNLVRNNRARGALFSSPRRTVCEKNTFDHTSGTAILLCGDCNGWYESGAVRDLVIRKNKFVNALTSLYQFTEAVISICPEIPSLRGQSKFFHGGSEQAIRIVDNEFDTFDAPILYAKSVDGLVFMDNKFKQNTEYAPFHPNREAVKLDRVGRNLISCPGFPSIPGNARKLAGKRP